MLRYSLNAAMQNNGKEEHNVQKHKIKNSISSLAAIILVLSMIPINVSSTWGAMEFPLRINNGTLVADENTKYITNYSQCPDSKLITATVQIQNNTDAENIEIQAIVAAISFDERVAPYSGWADAGYNPNLLFGYGKNVAGDEEFNKYCDALPYLGANDYGDQIYFDSFGSQYIKRDNSGGIISTKLSKPAGDTNPDLIIEPGQTVDIIKFYFMPVNGTDELDIDMFGYEHEYDAAELIWISPLLASEASYMAAATDGMHPAYSYVVSPESFKVHVQRPLPIYADDIGRAVIGYDAGIMEWSYNETGPFENGAPVVKNEAHTIYIREKPDAGYSGNDALFGNYKKHVYSDMQLYFDANTGAADYSLVNAAVTAAEAIDRTMYTTNSLIALDTATANVVYGLDAAQQAAVDGFAAAINTAIASLIEYVQITSIQISAPTTVTIPRGATLTFAVILNPGACDDDIVWDISNPTIATVTGNGNVTILNKTGTVTLAASDPVSGLQSSIVIRVI